MMRTIASRPRYVVGRYEGAHYTYTETTTDNGNIILTAPPTTESRQMLLANVFLKWDYTQEMYHMQRDPTTHQLYEVRDDYTTGVGSVQIAHIVINSF
jgi:hypothetical protein